MQYILEFFDFFKKNEPAPEFKNWKDKVEYVYNKYKEIKSNPPKDYYFLEADVESDKFDINFMQFIGKSKVDIHLYFKNRNGYEIVDFSEVDYDNMQSDKGHYKITKEEYDKYLPYAKEISEFLDSKSEKEYKKSGSFMDEDGDIHIDKSDLVIDELNYELEDKLFNKYIGKEYEFEIAYNLNKSKDQHEKVVERRNLKIGEIRVDYGGSRFYMTIQTKGPLGENCQIWLEGDTKSEYFDMNTKFKSLKDFIKMNIIEPEKSRKQKREEVQKYPYTIWYEISPCKYDTIEFIREMTELLREMTEQAKEKE